MSSGTLSKSLFAAHLGVSPSYVTKLAQAGRLVLAADGRVLVAESLERIDATRDPRRDDVREKFAKVRDGRRGGGEPITASPGDLSGAGDGSGSTIGKEHAPAPDSEPGNSAASLERRARTLKMHFESRRAIVRVAALQGRLTGADQVKKLAANDGATLRSLLENLADQAAPRLAPVRDVEACGRILGELLGDVAATLDRLLEKNVEAMRQAAMEAAA